MRQCSARRYFAEAFYFAAPNIDYNFFDVLPYLTSPKQRCIDSDLKPRRRFHRVATVESEMFRNNMSSLIRDPILRFHFIGSHINARQFVNMAH